jgi:hypothetical protein
MSMMVLIAIILLSSNFTIINAQSLQQQQMSSQLGAAATTFQSIDDSFRVEVPSGWIIQDIDNTGAALLEESRQGYGMLAQLCPVEQQQQQQGATVLPNATGGSGGSTNTISSINASRCLGALDVIHIVRYPDLEIRMQPADNITTYYLQKLEEVGYVGIQAVSSTDTTVNIINPQTNQTIATVPAKFAEIIYSTIVTPDEVGKGYFILTATNLTAPNVGTTKGYSVFYEVGSATAEAEITRTLPAAVEEVFGSFELIAAAPEEVIAEQQATTVITEQTEQTVQGGGFGQVIQSECDPSYPNVCIPPPPPDLNCDDIDARNFTVLSPDPHGFDGDNDGIGCDLPGGPGGDNVGDGDGSDDEDDGDDNGGGGDNSCHPSYPDVCIPPPPPDLNCDDEGVPEDIRVVGSDPHGFDGNDNDGIGCESESDAPDNDDNGGDDGDGDNGGGGEPEPEPGDGGDGGENGEGGELEPEPEPEPGDGGGEGGGDEPT